ncbi:hypothetical protein [Amycolatopsis sp. NPDC059021]|uniref:hypothetical protein n=1 Tax=Amycolatopsis sp. NPDC059021 TaxID=3346704 RepID=UPI003670317C
MAHATPQQARLLMSLPEIAEMAGVQRPVVTTWRRRHLDFPVAATTIEGRPLFDGREVCAWLVGTGRAQRAEIEPDLQVYALAAVAQQTGTERLLTTATALLCLQHLDGEPLRGATSVELIERAQAVDVDDCMLGSEIADDPDGAAALVNAVDDLVEAAWGAQPAFERLLTVVGRLSGSGADRFHPHLPHLMAGLSGASRHTDQAGSVRIADPWAGRGDLLLATAALLGEAHNPVFVAAERDKCTSRLLRRRLRVHGFPAEDIVVTNNFDDEVAPPDALVTALPYLSGEERSVNAALDTIDSLSLWLAPGRTAVILGPAEALTAGLKPYTAEERLRAKLLASGMVEAILRLPGGMVPARPGYDTALWVLTANPDPRAQGWVLLGDISDQELSAEVVDACTTDVVTWHRDGYRPTTHSRRHFVQVAVRDLVEPPRPLTPVPMPSVRERVVVVPQTVARLRELEAVLARPRSTPEPIESGLVIAEDSNGQRATVGALMRRGWLRLGQGSRIATEHLSLDGHHPVLGPIDLSSQSSPGLIDRAVLATEYPRASLTEPGDVLVTLTPEPAVYLDERGFSVIRFPVRRLRVTPNGQARCPPAVLAALLETSLRARTAGAVRPARKLVDWELPVLSAATAAQLDALLKRIAAQRRQVQSELDSLDELWRIATAGITNATLTFPR